VCACKGLGGEIAWWRERRVRACIPIGSRFHENRKLMALW
jgi:hypothetical protein